MKDLLNKITKWCEENKKNTDFISVRNGFQEHGNFDGKEETVHLGLVGSF